jgi:predicted PurR-regulated permease PerM
LPQYLQWLQHTGIPVLSERLGFDEPIIDIAALQESLRGQWQQAGGAVKGVVGIVSKSGMTLIALIANLILIPVVTFYMLRDWDILVERVHELIPRRFEPVIVRLTRSSDEVLGAFLRGQLTVMLALGIIYSVGLSIVGLELALLIGMLAGVVSFVPYLGFIVGIIAAGIAAVMQFHEFLPLVYVAIVFGIGQMVEGMVLTPLLVGEKIGLHPVAVIFAVMAGGQLFGFFGILLALPVAAVVMVLLRYTHEQYVGSSLYAETDNSE